MYTCFSCLWHACEQCFPDRSGLWIDRKQTFNEVYENSSNRDNEIKQEFPKATYIVKYEHDFDEECGASAEQQTFVDKCEIPEPIRPRDGYYGGRVEVMTLRQKFTNGRFLDFNSIYPW